MKRYASCHPLSKVYITIDSFSNVVPDNWETIAAGLNERIDKIIADEHITEECDYPDYMQLMSITNQVDELWQKMLDGSLPDLRPVYPD